MPTTSTPLAVTLPPSEHPYSFVELVAFRGDFPPLLGFVNPKGIAYHRQLDRLVVSLSPSGYVQTREQVLNLVTREGARTRFAPDYKMYTSVESKIAIVPDGGPPVAAGFTPGELFLGRGPQTEISRLSAGGEVLDDVFADFGPGGGFWGGLAFDVQGDFGGRLIAAEANGKIYLLNPDGTWEFLIDLALRLEGLAVAPPTFGPHAKNMIVGVEGYGDADMRGGEVYAVSPAGTATLVADIGYAAEDIQFVPELGGTFYQTQLCFDRERENRIFSVSAGQFLNRAGRMIVNNELTGELWEVAWDGERYTQQNVGTVPGRWSTAGFNVQGTELEAACFAVKTPRIPNWTDWQPIPGDFATDRAPAAAADPSGEVVLFGKGVGDRRVYINRQEESLAALPDPDDRDRQWRGWRPDPFRIVTPHAPACSLHNNQMYAFAVRPEGNIVHKFYTPNEDEQTVQSWQDVPGGIQTNTGVACATVNGRLVLSVLSQDRKILLNELAPGGRYWSGWYQIPGGGSTDATPTVVSFQDELYVFIKGIMSKRILVKTRTLNGDWMPWAEIPGAGRTEAPINAVAAGGQLFVFVLGTDQLPYVNIAGETGTWTGWLRLPNTVAVGTSLASAVTGNRVVLFAKATDTQQVLMRSTL